MVEPDTLRRAVRKITLVCGLFGALPTVPAQKDAPAKAVKVPLLRAYADLVQVPILVLTAKTMLAPPLTKDQFRLSLDSGRYFTTSYVRQEGVDAIQLAILLDASPKTAESLPGLLRALPELAGTSLHANDVVSITILRGCSLAHLSAVTGVAADLNALSETAERELSKAAPADKPECTGAPPLWGAARIVMNRLDNTPGRRVLLLVTDGVDSNSSTSMQQAKSVATATNVTIFGVREEDVEDERRESYLVHAGEYAYALAENMPEADPLAALTEMTGGLTLETHGRPADSIAHVITMLRERYVVDFRRPTKLTGRLHSIEAHVTVPHTLVLTSGVGYREPDADEEGDPNRVPSDRSGEPPVGTRRIVPR